MLRTGQIQRPEIRGIDTMKFRFVCKEHNLQLDGYPLWNLVKANPDEFEVGFRDMWCPTDSTGEDRACQGSWAIEFDQKITIPAQRKSGKTGHTARKES